MGDFLGTGTVAPQNMVFLEFEEAKKFIQSIGIKSGTEFRKWSKSGQRPPNFPSTPGNVYKGKGWKGMGDFLGTGNRPRGQWKREEAPET